MFKIIKIFFIKLLIAIRKNISPNTNLQPNENNQKDSQFVEKSINAFRNRNCLIPFIHKDILKNICKKHSEVMFAKNQLIYDYKCMRISMALHAESIFCKNSYLFVAYDEYSADKIIRNLLSSMIYRSVILSDNFENIVVYIFNGYCSIILTSKF